MWLTQNMQYISLYRLRHLWSMFSDIFEFCQSAIKSLTNMATTSQARNTLSLLRELQQDTILLNILNNFAFDLGEARVEAKEKIINTIHQAVYEDQDMKLHPLDIVMVQGKYGTVINKEVKNDSTNTEDEAQDDSTNTDSKQPDEPQDEVQDEVQDEAQDDEEKDETEADSKGGRLKIRFIEGGSTLFIPESEVAQKVKLLIPASKLPHTQIFNDYFEIIDDVEQSAGYLYRKYADKHVPKLIEYSQIQNRRQFRFNEARANHSFSQHINCVLRGSKNTEQCNECKLLFEDEHGDWDHAHGGWYCYWCWSDYQYRDRVLRMSHIYIPFVFHVQLISIYNLYYTYSSYRICSISHRRCAGLLYC